MEDNKASSTSSDQLVTIPAEERDHKGFFIGEINKGALKKMYEQNGNCLQSVFEGIYEDAQKKAKQNSALAL